MKRGLNKGLFYQSAGIVKPPVDAYTNRVQYGIPESMSRDEFNKLTKDQLRYYIEMANAKAMSKVKGTIGDTISVQPYTFDKTTITTSPASVNTAQTFEEAYRDAVKRGLTTFMFEGRRIAVKNDPNFKGSPSKVQNQTTQPISVQSTQTIPFKPDTFGSQQTGDYVSKMGYRFDSPFQNAKQLTINTPNGVIDMSKTPRDLFAQSDNGYETFLKAGSGLHYFPGAKYVTEHRMQSGGNQDQIQQIIQAFFQIKQVPEQEQQQFLQQFQSLPPEKQQEMIQQMAQVVQEAQEQDPNAQIQQAMQMGGYYNPYSTQFNGTQESPDHGGFKKTKPLGYDYSNPYTQYMQQGGAQQGNEQEQIMQMIAQALQQGKKPEEILQALVQSGVPQEQAQQMIQEVIEQMQGSQEQPQQENTPQDQMQSGGIHIKESHKGLFTAKASKHGMGVQEFASHVLANKDSYSPSTVKQANFARNAKSFKHETGGVSSGLIMQTAGKYLPNADMTPEEAIIATGRDQQMQLDTATPHNPVYPKDSLEYRNGLMKNNPFVNPFKDVLPRVDEIRYSHEDPKGYEKKANELETKVVKEAAKANPHIARSGDVKTLQTKLKESGFDPKGIDGVYGTNTKAAVIAFQKAHGLTPDGIAGAKTLAAMGLSTTSLKNAMLPTAAKSKLLPNPVPEKTRIDDNYARYNTSGVIRGVGKETQGLTNTTNQKVVETPIYKPITSVQKSKNVESPIVSDFNTRFPKTFRILENLYSKGFSFNEMKETLRAKKYKDDDITWFLKEYKKLKSKGKDSFYQ